MRAIGFVERNSIMKQAVFLTKSDPTSDSKKLLLRFLLHKQIRHIYLPDYSKYPQNFWTGGEWKSFCCFTCMQQTLLKG